MKEKQRNPLDVTRNGVQLTVNGDLGLNGLLVQKHAKEERNLGHGKYKYRHPMGDMLVLMERQRKQLHVTRTSAQSTVNGELGLNGLLAQNMRRRREIAHKASRSTGIQWRTSL